MELDHYYATNGLLAGPSSIAQGHKMQLDEKSKYHSKSTKTSIAKFGRLSNV